MISQLVFLPSIMLSGIMFPLTLLPKALSLTGKIFPAFWGYLLLQDGGLTFTNFIYLLLLFFAALLLCGIKTHTMKSFLKTYHNIFFFYANTNIKISDNNTLNAENSLRLRIRCAVISGISGYYPLILKIDCKQKSCKKTKAFGGEKEWQATRRIE